MIYKQNNVRYIFKVFYAVVLFSVLFLISFWWKMHAKSINLQHEYESLKDVDRPPSRKNVTLGQGAENRTIHIATSVCSSSFKSDFTNSRESAAILIKSIIISALIYNVPRLTFHLFLQNYEQDSNYFARLKFEKYLNKDILNIEIYSYPVADTIPQDYQQNIRDPNLYCLYNKLFLSSILANLDAVIYLDSSMVMVGNIAMCWDQFKRLHSYELLGVAVVPEPYATRDHKNIKAHTKGMDSNLLLMNLTRMRETHWENNFLPLYKQGSRQLGYFISDQQLVDTLLYYGTDCVMPLTCQFNYIMSKESCCAHAEKDTSGIRAIRPDFNSSLSIKTFKSIHDLVKSAHLRIYGNSTAYFQDSFMIPLRQLVASAFGTRIKTQKTRPTTKPGETSKKKKCELPLYKLIFRQHFG